MIRTSSVNGSKEMKDEGLAMAIELITPGIDEVGTEWLAIQFWAVVRRDPEDEGSVQVASMRSKMVKLEQGNTPCTMKKTIYVAAAIIVAAVIGVAFFATTKVSSKQVETVEASIQEPKKELTHKQRVWLGALEWCESQGEFQAINQVDKDGTPSYYNFQFKPGTFQGFGEKYGLIKKGKTPEEIAELMKNYELTYAIMEQMVLDPDISNHEWRYQQFPGCVAKLGTPPRLSTTLKIDKK